MLFFYAWLSQSYLLYNFITSLSLKSQNLLVRRLKNYKELFIELELKIEKKNFLSQMEKKVKIKKKNISNFNNALLTKWVRGLRGKKKDYSLV